jgi:uncharacterized lipoprotein YmbA
VLKVLLFVSLPMLLTACFSWGGGEEEELEPRYYVVDVDRGAVAQEFPQGRVLLLKPVRVVPHFRDKAIVFRVNESEYQSQASHLLFSEPEEMFTAQLRRWLQKSGLFSQVVVDDSVEADFVLESAVTALYGEKRPEYSPQSILEMQFFMSNADDQQKMLFQTGLRVDVDIEQTTPGNVVTGWKQGLEELLATLEQDLSDYFSKVDAR